MRKAIQTTRPVVTSAQINEGTAENIKANKLNVSLTEAIISLKEEFSFIPLK